LDQSFPSPNVQVVRGALFRNIRHNLWGSSHERLPPSATRRTRPYAVVPQREETRYNQGQIVTTFSSVSLPVATYTCTLKVASFCSVPVTQLTFRLEVWFNKTTAKLRVKKTFVDLAAI